MSKIITGTSGYANTTTVPEAGDARLASDIETPAQRMLNNDENLKALISSHVGQGGTTQHPVATTAVAGFMSAPDKSKLSALPPTFFWGYVKGDGTVTHIPSGWSLAITIAGNYVLTHNLGLTNPETQFFPVVTSEDPGTFAECWGIAANDFHVLTNKVDSNDPDGYTPFTTDFRFIIIYQP